MSDILDLFDKFLGVSVLMGAFDYMLYDDSGKFFGHSICNLVLLDTMAHRGA